MAGLGEVPLLLCNSEENFVSSVAAHSLIPVLGGRGKWLSEFKVSVVYLASSRPNWTTEREATLGRGRDHQL